MRKANMTETAKRQYLIRVTGDPYLALLGAVIEQARNEGDLEAIEEWKDCIDFHTLQADWLQDKEHGIRI